MTMIETAGADVRAAAATTDTDHAAPLTIAGADDLRVLESLVDECVQEEEAGAARMIGRGLGESPEGDLDRAPDPHLHERTSTRRRPPITPRKKCDGRAPHPAQGPGPYQGRALVHVLGPDPGRDASQEDARKCLLPVTLIQSVGPELVICQEKFVLT